MFAALALLAAQAGALAASTDIANAPLFTSSSNTVKPNIMFIMDDSGSMKRDYMPDEAAFSSTKYGRFTSQCNGVAYNPGVVYSLPVNADGTTKAAASLDFITPNPTNQLDNTRTVTPTPLVMTAVGTSINLTVTGGGTAQNGWYETGDTITLYSSGDATKWVEATVTSWNKNTRRLVVEIDVLSGVTVGGSLSSLRIGDGKPKSATYYRYTGTKPKLSYTYNTSGVITTTDFYKECNSTIGGSTAGGANPGVNVFTAVTVTNASTEAQNYANWYLYYRTRMDMMKSSISLAFKNVDSRYRIGYTTISQEDVASSDSFLDVSDFNATQKTAFYTKFNNAQPIVNTPLRGALSKAGRYYAKKVSGQTYDPVQYSCQKNFTILSTDGVWNSNDETTSYGPYIVNANTAVAQQDGSGTLRPMLDGTTVTTTTTETWTTSVGTITTVITPQVLRSSSTRSSTTYKPIAGHSRSSYTQLALRRDVDSMSRCSFFASNPCLITVETDGAHGMNTGDKVRISNSNPSDYNGDFVVTVTGSSAFTYTLSSRPPSYSGSARATPLTAVGCNNNQGKPMVQEQRAYTYRTTLTSVISSTNTSATLTTVITRGNDTPYSRVVIVKDGVQISDTTSAGTTVPSNSSVPTTVSATTGTPQAITTTVTTATVSSTFSNSGAETTGTTCIGSYPNPNPSASTAIGTSTTSTTTINHGTVVSPAAVLSSSASTTTTQTIGPVDTVHVTTSSSATQNGTNNSLADVAAYYYKTDLRTSDLNNCTGALGTDVCNNIVPGSTSDAAHSYGDSANWQHMTTFTLGLGAGGTLKYDPAYLTQLSGDFYDIVNGVKNWPAPDGGPANIDDLWHAAVNGRGQYFSATDPASLAVGLNGALDSIKAITGSASAASTSSLEPVEGDNDIYVAQFTSVKWTGDVLAYKINPATGAISSTTTWSARTQLDLAIPASRQIYYPKFSGSVGSLRAFNFGNLDADGYGAHFASFCTKTGANGGSSPEQCATLSVANKAIANSGTNLVNYLRGDQTMATVFRTRDNVLGDIISASPLYVGKPSFKYTENGYSSYASNSTRTGVIYAAANDGMLHALDRTTGDEVWAFIPSFVIPNLYKLADTSYANNHSFYVDGAPAMGDIYVGGAWKTVLIGGLNAGGRGYYALDITHNGPPKVLWEFKETDLGLSFGNPVITKRQDGTWVVIFTSGYNNNENGGSGNGYLYVLDANTGTQLLKIPTYTTGTTPAGDATTPSGLNKINAWIDSEVSNTAKRFYGGDLLGNLWRFDIDNLVAPNQAALRLAELKVGSAPQPITTRPVLAEVNYNGTAYPVVYVATGRYLGTSDLNDTTQQSIYAIKDPMANAPHGNVRNTTTFVVQTFSEGVGSTGSPIRTASNNAVDWTTKSGWRIDYLSSGERTNINPQLVLNTLFVGSNIPSNDACTVGGSSWLYKLDIGSGSAVSNAKDQAAGVPVGNILIQGLTTVRLQGTGNGDGSIVTVVTRSDGTLQTIIDPPPPVAGALRRTSWRELVD